MIDFPGRQLINTLLPRKGKEALFRIYNLSNLTIGGMLKGPMIFINKNRPNYPKCLGIFLTTRCNLRCSICDRKEAVSSDMDFENIFKLKNPIKYAKMIDLTGWGEAILYPRYAEVVEYILSVNDRKKLISQTINGTMADKYGDLLKGRLQRLVISLNAATEKTYNQEMKGGDFNKTLASVKALLSKLTGEDRRTVRLHFVAHTRNYSEMPLFVQLSRSLDIRQVSFGQYLASSPESEPDTLLNVKEAYNATLGKVDEAAKKFGVEVFYRRFGENLGLSVKNCMFPYEWCYVRTDGSVTPCCYLGDVSMGNIYEESFESIWFGDKMQDLRKSRYFPACSACAPFRPFDNPACHFTSRYNLKKMGEKEIG